MSKILVIEDNQDIREELVEILRFEGFDVVEAEDGRSGLRLAQDERPDLILCDVMMPHLDGFGALAAVRDDPATSSVPFLFLSARREDTDLQLSLDLGADGYLRKPFDIHTLLGAINAQLSRSRSGT